MNLTRSLTGRMQFIFNSPNIHRECRNPSCLIVRCNQFVKRIRTILTERSFEGCLIFRQRVCDRTRHVAGGVNVRQSHRHQAIGRTGNWLLEELETGYWKCPPEPPPSSYQVTGPRSPTGTDTQYRVAFYCNGSAPQPQKLINSE